MATIDRRLARLEAQPKPPPAAAPAAPMTDDEQEEALCSCFADRYLKHEGLRVVLGQGSMGGNSRHDDMLELAALLNEVHGRHPDDIFMLAGPGAMRRVLAAWDAGDIIADQSMWWNGPPPADHYFIRANAKLAWPDPYKAASLSADVLKANLDAWVEQTGLPRPGVDALRDWIVYTIDALDAGAQTTYEAELGTVDG